MADVNDAVGLRIPAEPPRPHGSMAMLQRIVTAQNIGALIGLVTLAGLYATYVKAGVTRDADYTAAVRHSSEFEISADKRLNDLRAEQEALTRERDARDTALQAKLDELGARFTQRTEVHNEQWGITNQRIGALELKVCILAGRKVADCK